MKRYKLLKDLPTFKAGDEFFISQSGNLIAGTPEEPKTVRVGEITPTEVDLMAYAKETLEQFPNILTDWFEEIKEPKLYFIIDFFRKDVIQISDAGMMGWSIDNVKSLGLLFETEQEAEEHLEYLEAKEIIRQDAKGFKPDWTDEDETKYYGYWGFKCEEPDCGKVHITKEANIYFKSSEDLKESFRKHPKEWRTYLTYEQ